MFEPCFCGSFDCPSCGPLQGVAQPTHYALGSLSAEDIDLLNDGTRVVPLYSESGTYREWDVTVAGIKHSIIDEDGAWTLMVYVPTCLEWCDVPGMDVDTFLRTHRLILAA